MSATNYSQCSVRKLQHLNKSHEISVQKQVVRRHNTADSGLAELSAHPSKQQWYKS